MTRITVRSTEREQILDITPQVRAFVAKARPTSGLLAVYCPHTTAAVSVNENADPDVKSDMVRFMRKLVPQSREFKHAEDNSDAHIKGVLAGCSQIFLVEDGTLLLGRWQEIYFMEFDGPREREVWLKLIAE